VAVALEAEVDAYVAGASGGSRRSVTGRRAHAAPRPHVKTSPAPSRSPHRGRRQAGRREKRRAPEFHSSILLPWCRRARRSAVLPLLYLPDSRRVTSCRPCRSSSRRSGLSDRRRPLTRTWQDDRKLSPHARWPRSTTSTSGSTASTSTCAWARTAVLSGRGRVRRRAKRARGHHRRLPRVDRVLASF